MNMSKRSKHKRGYDATALSDTTIIPPFRIKREAVTTETQCQKRRDNTSPVVEMQAPASSKQRQNGFDAGLAAQLYKTPKINNNNKVEEISSSLNDEEFSNDDIFNTFLFHDDPGHRSQADNVLSVNSTPKDWISLFFTETVYEMMECKGDWDQFSGSTKESKIYLALLLQMGAVKLPEMVQYWSTDQTTFSSNLWLDNMKVEDFFKAIRCDSDYCKTFIEAINGSLEEFCHSRIEYNNNKEQIWRGKVAIRRYLDASKSRVEASIYVLTDDDGLILKIIHKKESERAKSVDIIMELLRKSCGFGRLFNRCDVYVGMELAVVSKDVNTKEKRRSDRINSVWKFIDIEVKSVKVGDGSATGGQKELLLVNLIKNREAMVEFDGLNNVFLTNVDFGNRCRNWSRLSWRSRIIIDVINLTVNTAFILNSRYSHSEDSLLEFRNDLIQSLLVEALTPTPVVEEEMIDSTTLFLPYADHNSFNHHLNEIVEQDGPMEPIAVSPQDVMSIEHVGDKDLRLNLPADGHDLIFISEEKPRPRRRCRRCYKRGIRKETSYMCAACPGQYVLCPTCHPEHVEEINSHRFSR